MDFFKFLSFNEEIPYWKVFSAKLERLSKVKFVSVTIIRSVTSSNEQTWKEDKEKNQYPGLAKNAVLR